MKSLSLRFKTVQRLESFISDNKLINNNALLVQIYSPTKDTLELQNTINTLLPNSTIVGVNADKSLLNGVVIDNEIIINFLILNDCTIESRYFKDEASVDNYFFMDTGALYLTHSSNLLSKDNFIKAVSNKITLIGTFYNQFILHESVVRSSGLVALKINGKFDIDIKIVDKIEPIGRELRVEDIEGNILKKIGNFTPTNLYKHYLSHEFSNELSTSSCSFPLLKRIKKSYQSSIILKSLDNGVKLTNSLEVGDSIQLGFAHSKSYYDEFQKIVDSLSGKSYDIFFIYNSIAREKYFKDNGFEYKSAVGSYSNSELVIYKNKIHNLNLSSIFLLLNKNSSQKLQKKSYKSLKPDISWDIDIVDALSNIAKVSSSELQTLNQQLETKVVSEIEKSLKKDAVLIHNAKLAQMGEMMSMIAHQWKQPLSAISATSSGLHIKIELDMYDKEFFLNSLAKIEEFVNHLSSTIDDFSNFFKPTKRKEKIELSKIVEKSMTIASYSLTKHSIKVQKELGEMITLDTYTNELVQVILNIIKNAENILIQREIKQPLILLRTFKKDEGIYIEISDNGGGIDNEIIEKVFEPYFSTKATRDSTGLGLYMSKLIVEDSLGGKLQVKNSEKGAVFSIVLV